MLSKSIQNCGLQVKAKIYKIRVGLLYEKKLGCDWLNIFLIMPDNI